MSAQAALPNWMQPVASPAGLAAVLKDDGPAVAFTPLALSQASRTYLHRLEADRARKPQQRMRIYNEVSSSQRNFAVSGFTSNPTRAQEARTTLAVWLKNALPAGPGRADLCLDLAAQFTDLAAGLNRTRLRFILREISSMGSYYFHEDDGADTTIGAYLCGPGTLQAAPGSYSWRDRHVYQDLKGGAPLIEYDPTPSLVNEAVQLPNGVMAAWPERQPHAIPPQDGGYRLSLFAFAENNARQPACEKPSWKHRFANWLQL